MFKTPSSTETDPGVSNVRLSRAAHCPRLRGVLHWMGSWVTKDLCPGDFEGKLRYRKTERGRGTTGRYVCFRTNPLLPASINYWEFSPRCTPITIRLNLSLMSPWRKEESLLDPGIRSILGLSNPDSSDSTSMVEFAPDES